MFPDAMGSVQRGIEVVEFASGAPHLLKGEHCGVGRPRRRRAFACCQPLGVCAGITPFNFPAMVPLWMFPIALACGNTFVLKPSEKDPSAVDPHGRAAEGGRPAGRRVQRRPRRQGGRRRDPASSRHQGGLVRRLDADRAVHLRDGRRSTASACRRSAAPRTTRSSCPTPTSTFAADALIGAAYGSAGERCMAISAVVAVGDAGDPLVAKLADEGASAEGRARARPRAWTWGRSSPRAHRDKVSGYVDAGVAEGATLVVDGRGLTIAGHERRLLPRRRRCSTT